MGISDDIRPKKFRPISKKSVEKKIIVDKNVSETDDASELFQKQHDGDFFSNTPISDKQPKPKNDTAKKQPQKTKNHRWIYSLMIILTISALIGLVVWQNYSTIKSYFDGSYKNKNSQNLSDIINSANNTTKTYNKNQSTSVQNSVATQSTATTSAIDKSKILISVLNGSGVKSSAASVASMLKTAGFSVKNISNAKSFNYAKTYIYYKTDDATAANLVRDALPNRQTEVSKNTSVVGSTYDIVVVVGKT